MSDQTDNTIAFLKQFGLSNEESSLYLYLLKNGNLSALEISRNVHMGRTKIYRILGKLVEKGLVRETLEESGKKFEASSLDQIEMLLKEKEAELESLKEEKSKVFTALERIQGQEDKHSKILYYSGIEGLKQITWNSLHAEKELFIFEMNKNMNPFSGDKFAEKMREEFFLKKIITNQLTNMRKFEPFTNIEQYVKYCMRVRYIDPDELKMDFELLIYNDVVAIYTYRDKDIFGIEICNKNLALMQKQIFQFMWMHAKQMKIGPGGSAKVI